MQVGGVLGVELGELGAGLDHELGQVAHCRGHTATGTPPGEAPKDGPKIVLSPGKSGIGVAPIPLFP